MGCVISPAAAKFVLDTILVAIHLVVKGIRLFGYEPSDVAHTWREICSLAFADDWLGIMRNVAEVRKVWALWTNWEVITGSKLGIKARGKTVLTGIMYGRDGRPCEVVDPKLFTAYNTRLPFMPYHVAYKYLGRYQRADGIDDVAWAKLLAKLEVALCRLRSLHNISLKDFYLVSEAILNGLVGAACQTMYITFEQAKIVEAKWRAIYGAKFRRVRSAPRAPLYSKGSKALDGGRTLRTHLWSTCLTSISAAVAAAMGDVGDTQQRAAVRSGVALSMEKWGCREDPNRWRWGHLTENLEQFLKESPVKYLGDAWMLAQSLAEGHTLAGDEKAATLAAARVMQRGRWEFSPPPAAPEPLAPGAAHWRRPESTMLFEPAQAAGLGIQPSTALLQAGVVAVEHLSSRARVWL